MIGVSLKTMKIFRKFLSRHPLVAFSLLMIAMWAHEQAQKEHKNPLP